MRISLGCNLTRGIRGRLTFYESDMEAQLDLAAELGMEVFVLDDGWFRGWDAQFGWGAGAGW